MEKSFTFWGTAEGDAVHPAECMHKLLEQVRRHKVNIDGNVCTVMVTTLVLEVISLAQLHCAHYFLLVVNNTIHHRIYRETSFRSPNFTVSLMTLKFNFCFERVIAHTHIYFSNEVLMWQLV